VRQAKVDDDFVSAPLTNIGKRKTGLSGHDPFILGLKNAGLSAPQIAERLNQEKGTKVTPKQVDNRLCYIKLQKLGTLNPTNPQHTQIRAPVSTPGCGNFLPLNTNTTHTLYIPLLTFPLQGRTWLIQLAKE
jgi:hypothetical protein